MGLTLILPSPEETAKKSEEGLKDVNRSLMLGEPMLLLQKFHVNWKLLQLMPRKEKRRRKKKKEGFRVSSFIKDFEEQNGSVGFISACWVHGRTKSITMPEFKLKNRKK